MERPAIILVTCDELRRDVLSFYGNQAIKTPNIDAIAAGGTAFDKCYTVSPLCLPARCSILTGLYPHRSGAYSNFRKCALDKGIDNLFTALKGSGYGTALVGKCHFAPVDYGITTAERTLPYDGFKEYYMSLGIDHLDLQDDKQVSIWFYDDYSKELEEKGLLTEYRDRHWKKENRVVYKFPGPADMHPDAWVGRKAVEFIENDGKEKPEFLWVSFSGPHYPFDTPEEYLSRVDGEKLSERIYDPDEFSDPSRIHYKSYNGGGRIDGAGRAPDRACKNYSEDYWKRLRVSYNANMVLIDDYVGKIEAAAKEKYGDNYLIIFTADHGEMLGNHGMWGKHDCAYEEVWNIPMFVRFPGGNEDLPKRTDVMVNSNDILPTCLTAAGVELFTCDGEDLRARVANGGLKYTFSESEGFVSVTDGELKYVHVQKVSGDFRELLDRKADPNEFENKINDPAYASRLSVLREKVIEHFVPKVLP